MPLWEAVHVRAEAAEAHTDQMLPEPTELNVSVSFLSRTVTSEELLWNEGGFSGLTVWEVHGPRLGGHTDKGSG